MRRTLGVGRYWFTEQFRQNEPPVETAVSVDSEKVKAVGRNGVLEITIPKQAKAQPRRIKVAA